MSRLFNFGKNLYNNYYLTKYLKNYTTMTKEIKGKKELEYIAVRTEAKEDIEVILQYLSEALSNPERVKSEQEIQRVLNTFRLIGYLISHGSHALLPYLREKMNMILIFSQLKDIHLNFDTINSESQKLFNALDDDDKLKEYKEEATKEDKLEKLEVEGEGAKKISEIEEKIKSGVINSEGFEEVQCGTPADKSKKKTFSCSGLKFLKNVKNEFDDELPVDSNQESLRSPAKVPKGLLNARKRGFKGMKLRLGAPPSALKDPVYSENRSTESTQESQKCISEERIGNYIVG